MQINPEEIIKVVERLQQSQAACEKHDTPFAKGCVQGYRTSAQIIKAQFPELFKK